MGDVLSHIVVRLEVGSDRLAASDDPLFLVLRGPAGREFRLAYAKGKSLRRGQEDTFVLGGAEANVAWPELNDPGAPALAADGVEQVVLRKGLSPIPNVRGFHEMDDRLQLDAVEIALHPAGGGAPRRFARSGGFWLGLVCGLSLEIPPQDGEA